MTSDLHNELLTIVRDRRPDVSSFKGGSPPLLDEKAHPPTFDTGFVDGKPALFLHEPPCPATPAESDPNPYVAAKREYDAALAVCADAARRLDRAQRRAEVELEKATRQLRVMLKAKEAS